MTTHQAPTVDSLYRPLWLTYGLVPLLAGLDKFLNLLADWPSYVHPMLIAVLPISAEQLMMVVGVVEIGVGLLVLTRWPRLGAWIAAAWLVLIAVTLIGLGKFDIAVRDLAMAVGAMTLARLAHARERAVLPAARFDAVQA